MPLFSYSVLAKALQSLEGHLTPNELLVLAKDIDHCDEESINTEWEIMIMSALASVGKISYEIEYGGKRPDIWLAREFPEYDLVAEVRTVSDSGLPDNRIRTLIKRLRVPLEKRKLAKDNLSIKLKQVHYDYNVEDLVDEPLELFLDSLVANRSLSKTFSPSDSPLEIVYHPAINARTVSYTLREHKNIEKNPFFKALRDKRNQLKQIPDITKGIFLCNGGSEMFIFRLTSQMSWGSDDVIRHFLHRYQEIDFVMTVDVSRKASETSSPRTYPIKTTLFENVNFSKTNGKIQEALRNFSSLFPEAFMQLDVARNCLSDGTIRKYIGGEKLEKLYKKT